MKKLSDKMPVFYCILAMAAFVVVLTRDAYLILCMNIAPGTYISSVICEALLLICGIFFMKGAGQEYVWRCKMNGFWKGIREGIFFLVIGSYTFFCFGLICLCSNTFGESDALGIDFSGYELQSGLYIASFIVYVILIGLAEEFMFRGVIAERLLRQYGKNVAGVRKAVLLSGVFFGAIHLINGFSTSLISCVIQAVVASAMGMALTLIYYKSGNIYAVAFIHAFVDFGAMAWICGIYAKTSSGANIASAMQYSWGNLVGVVPYIIVVLVMMKKNNIQAILKRIS